MYYPRHPRRRREAYGRGKIIQKSVGEVWCRPGALNMLGVGENVELRTWISPPQMLQVIRDVRAPNIPVIVLFLLESGLFTSRRATYKCSDCC